MKDITYYMRFFTLVLTFFFVACSGDDDDTVDPVFPELQKKECTVGQTATIEFEATSNWRLTSSALWCKFVVDNENVNSCSGAAGKQTVNIRISDEASEVEKSYKAELILWIGGAKKVIYEIARPTLGYEAKLCDKDGIIYTEENPCKALYGFTPSIYVKANFNWKLIEWPDWMICTETAGNALEVKSPINVSVKENYLKDPISGNFTFVNEKGAEVVVPIGYDGIPENEIAFSIKSKYGCKFSSDGKTYTGGGLETGESSEAPLNFTVMAKNDAYKVVLLNTADYMYSHMTTDWFKLDDDTKGGMKLSVTNNMGDPRKGCVMMFPKSVYDAIPNFDQTVIPDGEMQTAYEKYVVLEFEQQGKGGMKVTGGESGIDFPTISLLDEGYTEMNLMDLYGTKEVYRLVLDGAYDWLKANATSFSEMYCMLAIQFTEGASGWDGAGAEAGWPGGNFNINNIPAGATGQMIITVKDGNDFVHSVLIVQQGNSTFAAKKKLRK